MPELIMMVGIPASGKSTFVKQYESTPGYVVVGTDRILERIATEKDISYNQAMELYYNQANKEMNTAVDAAIAAGHSVIWDQTNLSKKTRSFKINRFPSSYQKLAVVVRCNNAEEHLRRLNSRPGKTIPQSVMDNMIANFEMPTTAEGFDTVVIIET